MTAFILHLVQFIGAHDHTGSIAMNANKKSPQERERIAVLDAQLLPSFHRPRNQGFSVFIGESH